MNTNRLFITLAALLFAPAAALALIQGDGKGKSEFDCFIGLEGYTTDDQTPFGKKGKPAIQCTDGDTACDLDGDPVPNGSCTFPVAVRVNNDPGDGSCTPAPLKKVKAKAKSKLSKIDFFSTASAPLDGSSVTSAFVNFSVPVKKFGKSKPKAGTGNVTLLATKPKDKDKFKFVCNPAGTEPPVTECTDNPDGGPRQLNMLVIPEGADLDNGFSGRSHNFPVPVGTTLKWCLSGCDGSTNPVCDAEGSTGEGSLNGETFGPPLPLFSANVPVCVVNEYKEATVRGTANVETGEFIAEVGALETPVVLNSKVFQCTTNTVCPRCRNGRCDGGARDGQGCTVDGTVIVNNPPAIINDLYQLSNQCPPGGNTCARLGAIEVLLDLTTGTSTLAADAAGEFPCPLQQQHQECSGSATCSVDCSPDGPNPVNDPKGGVSQWCCNDNSLTPCFPTSPDVGSNAIVRTGTPAPPSPAWPDPTYPKTGSGGKLAATFCEASTQSIAVDGTAGLPGPGALILPGDTEWLGNVN